MTSNALVELSNGIAEVGALRTQYPVRRGSIPVGVEASAAKAHGRACVVLLCSHYERYFYAVNEEAVAWLNAQAVALDRLPVAFLLQHSHGAVDALAQTAWLNRESRLRTFAAEQAPLWMQAATAGALNHREMLTWMKSPKPPDVVKLYRQYGITEVFSSVTRKQHTKRELFFDLKELVEKRNNIAHGDTPTEALPSDVTRYVRSVSRFARAADGVLARRLQAIAGAPARPW